MKKEWPKLISLSQDPQNLEKSDLSSINENEHFSSDIQILSDSVHNRTHITMFLFSSAMRNINIGPLSLR